MGFILPIFVFSCVPRFSCACHSAVTFLVSDEVGVGVRSRDFSLATTKHFEMVTRIIWIRRIPYFAAGYETPYLSHDSGLKTRENGHTIDKYHACSMHVDTYVIPSREAFRLPQPLAGVGINHGGGG